MSWSVREDGKAHTPEYLFQIFDKETWDAYPFAGEEKLKWFRDAKLGLFFHVGISAVGKVDIGWSRHTHKLPDPNVGEIPDEIYDGWAEELSLENFRAEEWIDLAIQGGFRYVVIITKHHDGFHMWDTRYSDYKITNAPFGRDYLGELIKACHEKGMPVGLYYSERDWHHPDYEPVDTEIAERITEIPFYRIKDGEAFRSGKRHRQYIEYMHNTVLELMEKYGKIDILWWDASWYNGMFLEEMWDSWKLEEKVRHIWPDIIINNRASVPGDFDTPECQVGFVQRNRAWETCMPMGEEWAWTGKGIKPWKEILNQFVYSVCGDGNYLLSIGAKPDGTIAKEEREGILKLGAWMNKFGESIYATRSGPWNPGSYGGSVYKENCIYLHLLNWNEEKGLRLPMIEGEIEQITCLSGEKIEFTLEEGELFIQKTGESIYGDIILKIVMDRSIAFPEEGIFVDEDGNVFDKSPAVYGNKIFQVKGQQEIFLDTGEICKGTAISIQGRSKWWKVETSCDGKEWIIRYENQSEAENPEIILSSYVAGAPVCGASLRYVRVSMEAGEAKLQLYGFLGKESY